MELVEKTGSSGVAKAGLTTGIIGTSLAGLLGLGTLAGGNGILGGLGAKAGNAAQAAENVALGALLAKNATPAPVQTSPMQGMIDYLVLQQLMGGGYNKCCCNEDHMVTRYDADKDAKIAHLETQVSLRDANTYTDQKLLELYQNLDGRIRAAEGQIAQQAVINQATVDKIALVEKEQECCCNSVKQMIATERDERRCGDNAIVNYVNATFYPKMIANVTTGTATTAQTLFNPLPVPAPSGVCGCGC